MIFSSMITELQNRLHDTSSATQTKIKNWINLAIKDILTKANWWFMRREGSIATTADDDTYVLPDDFSKMIMVWQEETPKRLSYVSEEDFRNYEPEPTATGNPLWYRLPYMIGVAEQPATAGLISFKSTAAGDTTQTCTIIGTVSGKRDTENVALNGTTSVKTTRTYSAILRISKSASTTGRVVASTGGVTIITLPPDQNQIDYQVIKLFPIPDEVITIYFDYFAKFFDMTENNETSPVPDDWINVVLSRAEMFGRTFKDDAAKYAEAKSDFGATLTDMMRHNTKKTTDSYGKMKSVEQRGDVEFLRFPANYPRI